MLGLKLNHISKIGPRYEDDMIGGKMLDKANSNISVAKSQYQGG